MLHALLFQADAESALEQAFRSYGCVRARASSWGEFAVTIFRLPAEFLYRDFQGERSRDLK